MKKETDNKKERDKFFRKALELNPSFKMKMKYFMIKTHIYSIYILALKLKGKDY